MNIKHLPPVCVRCSRPVSWSVVRISGSRYHYCSYKCSCGVFSGGVTVPARGRLPF